MKVLAEEIKERGRRRLAAVAGTETCDQTRAFPIAKCGSRSARSDGAIRLKNATFSSSVA